MRKAMTSSSKPISTATISPRSDVDLTDFVNMIFFFPVKVTRALTMGTVFVGTFPGQVLTGNEAENYDDLVVRPLAELQEGSGI